ncbi:hypothetical protein PR202_gb27407 [Eleusine coracana subsp. coracana]|uniref:Uncharacterized protein n=1 Tax=Eleusine coracana subsp. coracana TaxID=191504 RepID=A0AAV5FVY8_ELECO|nr:hypothetical protein PR202_gb27407 [Eleusine coracana subsp. coracana]
MEWLLKYEADNMLYANYIAALPYTNGRQPDGSWMVEEDNSENYLDDNIETGSEESDECDADSDDEYNSDAADIDENIETKSNESIEWDSDNDDIFTVEAKGDERNWERLTILGFHPYKEVVFLVGWFGIACYHFNSSKERKKALGVLRQMCYSKGMKQMCEAACNEGAQIAKGGAKKKGAAKSKSYAKLGKNDVPRWIIEQFAAIPNSDD